MIDVLVPVLNRPKNAQPLVDSFRAVSHQMDEIHFICSPGDEKQIEACRATGENVIIVDWHPGPGDYAKKMNYGYRNTERPFLFLGSDDVSFQPGWSERAMKVMKAVVATNDQANSQVKRGQFGTHCLVSRSYVDDPGASCDGPGFLVHEGYDHNFPDRELCHLAQSRGLYAFAKDSIVTHRHPLWRTARMDSTYRKGQAHFLQDRLLFLERAPLWNYVGVSPSERVVASRRRRDILRAR